MFYSYRMKQESPHSPCALGLRGWIWCCSSLSNKGPPWPKEWYGLGCQFENKCMTKVVCRRLTKRDRKQRLSFICLAILAQIKTTLVTVIITFFFITDTYWAFKVQKMNTIEKRGVDVFLFADIYCWKLWKIRLCNHEAFQHQSTTHPFNKHFYRIVDQSNKITYHQMSPQIY